MITLREQAVLNPSPTLQPYIRVPGHGPHMSVTSMYATGAVPFFISTVYTVNKDTL